ncbi:MAG: SDR family NAD(P)-dependent oxidoreductase [Bacteroidales bacterium]
MKEPERRRSTLQGKIAVITGSGRGIGKAIAVELARRGAKVVLSSRNEERLRKAEADIRQITQDVSAVCCDISSPEGGRFLIDEVLKTYSTIDILINNAGISMRGNLADLDPAIVRTVFEANVFTAANVTIPAMKHLKSSRGSLVFISSVSGIRGLPYQSVYSAAKMSLRALAESVRIEERGSGLHVGLVYVGYTENDPEKETISADGSRIPINRRIGRGVMKQRSVAEAVARSIERRRFITTLSPPGKLTAILQPLFPRLVEMVLARNIGRFMRHSH